ncbi:hemin-degrading factor [Pseudophaeobacter flagellatus]|uniref:hemin-degrading factor n=1 Tax=Pseudophaeobacter flagellatus TaxID=2899119 RepID=UPI001E52F94B|nr:ChuX/HutX family heme-like substrate-binding protein [Pseudophaeobacter flagellatus]MCD9149120.1 hemin-degrading factor [Pseudophaeobacter flagellatus]
MDLSSPLDPQTIRQLRQDHDTLRDRDFAAQFQITEAQLVAAYVGHGVTPIAAEIDAIFPRLADLGEVMALTRNDACVIEKIGHYSGYHPGKHAAMVLNPDIDLRLFPRHFISAFAVERSYDGGGIRRSLQFFDAAGDAVHKVHLRPASDLAAWDSLLADLALSDPSDQLEVAPRQAPEPARADPDKAALLRTGWAKMTDTHQFRKLTGDLKMNRLGAYRLAGAPLACPLAPSAVDTALQAIQDTGTEVMIFVGNPGCIQIHTGPVKNLRRMGPWQNILDPGFDLHLRLDYLTEVWAVNKPTKRGAAVSLEAFDAEGRVILQIFGHRDETGDHRHAWEEIVAALPAPDEATCAQVVPAAEVTQ